MSCSDREMWDFMELIKHIEHASSKQAHIRKLMELHASSWNCMQALSRAFRETKGTFGNFREPYNEVKFQIYNSQTERQTEM